MLAVAILGRELRQEALLFRGERPGDQIGPPLTGPAQRIGPGASGRPGAWSPDRSTSGTSQSRNRRPRVLRVFDQNRRSNDSSADDASLPITPGTRRVTASITTSAAASPPAST